MESFICNKTYARFKTIRDPVSAKAADRFWEDLARRLQIKTKTFFFHSHLRKLAADFMRLCCVGLLITYLSSVAKLSVAYYTTFWGIEYRKCGKSKIKDVRINNIVYSVKAGCWMLGHDGCTHGQRSRRTRSTHPPPHSPWHRVTVTMIILDFINFAVVDYLFLSF